MNANILNQLPHGTTIPIGGYIWTKESNGWVPSDIEHRVGEQILREWANLLPEGSIVKYEGTEFEKSVDRWYTNDDDFDLAFGTGELKPEIYTVVRVGKGVKILSAQEAEQLPNGSRIYLRSQDCIITKKDGLWHTPNMLAWGNGKLHNLDYEVL